MILQMKTNCENLLKLIESTDCTKYDKETVEFVTTNVKSSIRKLKNDSLMTNFKDFQKPDDNKKSLSAKFECVLQN